MKTLGFIMPGAKATTLLEQAGPRGVGGAMSARQVGDGLERLLGIIRSSSQSDTREAANRGEAREHGEVRERVGVMGCGGATGAGEEAGRDRAQQVQVPCQGRGDHHPHREERLLPQVIAGHRSPQNSEEENAQRSHKGLSRGRLHQVQQ